MDELYPWQAPIPGYSAGTPSWMNAYGAGQQPSGVTPGTGPLAVAGGPTATPPAQNSFWGDGGFNIGSVGTIAQGLGSLAGAYMGFKNYKLAKEGLDLQKTAFNTNMNNSIKQYNTSLEDRIRGRTSAYDGKEQNVQSYLARHSLSR